MRKFVKSIPNIISIMRIILIITGFYLFYLDNYRLGVAIIIIASCTDFIDGMLARKLDAVSEFGTRLDPIADRLVQILMVIILLLKDVNSILYIVLLELIYHIIFTYTLIKNKKWIPMFLSGKTKTWMFFTTSCCLLLTKINPIFNTIFYPLMIITLITQVWAIIDIIKICKKTTANQ